nr:MAG TPA: hypothetical protein [Caudoviricetes sp.]
MKWWKPQRKNKSGLNRNIANSSHLSACSHDLVVECILYP